MSNIEHLVENGVSHIQSGKGKDEFLSEDYNKEMLKYVSTTKDELWEICQYIVYTLIECILMEENKNGQRFSRR